MTRTRSLRGRGGRRAAVFVSVIVLLCILALRLSSPRPNARSADSAPSPRASPAGTESPISSRADAVRSPDVTRIAEPEAGRRAEIDVRGRVVDAQIVPVAQAAVICTLADTRERHVASVETGSDGRFAFQVPRPDVPLRLTASARGFASEWIHANAAADRSVIDVGDIVLLAGTSVSGTLEQSDGTRVARTTFRWDLRGRSLDSVPLVFGSPEPQVLEGESLSDDTGSFDLGRLPRGELTVYAPIGATGPHRTWVETGPYLISGELDAMPVRVVLPPVEERTIRVRDGEGRPIRGAEFLLDTYGPRWLRDATVDATREPEYPTTWRLRLPHGFRGFVEVRAPGFRRAQHAVQTAAADLGEVELVAGSDGLDLRITDRVGAEELRVGVNSEFFAGAIPRLRPVAVRDDGTVELAADTARLSPGDTAVVWAPSSGRWARTRPFEQSDFADGHRPLEVSLDASGTRDVRCSDRTSGRPVEGARVLALRPRAINGFRAPWGTLVPTLSGAVTEGETLVEAVTDERGAARLALPPGAACSIRVEAAGYGAETVALPRPEDGPFEVSLSPESRITIACARESDGARLVAVERSTRRTILPFTDDGGLLVFAGLGPGTYVVGERSAALWISTLAFDDPAAVAGIEWVRLVTLSAGENKAMTLGPFGAPAWVTGRLVGRLFDGLELEAVPDGTRAPLISQYIVPRSGEFAIGPLSPGVYTLVVLHRGVQVAESRVHVPASGLARVKVNVDVARVTIRRNAEPGSIWCAKLVASDGKEIGPYVANAATGHATADGRTASQVVIAAAAGTYRIQLGEGRRLADWSVRIDPSSWRWAERSVTAQAGENEIVLE